MNIIKNKKGIALVMVLVLSVITLAIISALIYFVTMGTMISGMEKRYKTALEASLGGADITYKLISLRGVTAATDAFLFNDLVSLNAWWDNTNVACTGTARDGTNYTGLEAKLMTSTTGVDGTPNWSVGCDSSLIIDPGVATTYDMIFELGADPQRYTVHSKIVDTVEGNSGAPPELFIPEFPPPLDPPGEHLPYLYTVEIDAQNATNPAERAKPSILYQY